MKRSPLPLTLRKKLLFATVSTVGFFVLLELLLATVGVRPESQQSDRTAGFSQLSPLMVETTSDDGLPLLSTAENKLHWFNYQEFPKQKSPGTRRVFCLGGSTTYGHPYWDATSFAGWLRQYLPIVDSQHKWEVINAGGISYGSYRVAILMEELSQYEPDFFIIYSAHNEFLERQTYADMFDQSAATHHLTALMSHTRVWTVAERLVSGARRDRASTTDRSNENALGEVNEELNHTIGPVDYHRDERWQARVIAQYRQNLLRMIDIARRCEAKIVLVTPASNEKDCSPFKSELLPSAASDRATMEALLISGDQAAAQENFLLAETTLRQAIKLDSGYADAHYRLGRVLLAQKKNAAAAEEFQQAIDCDVCPLRAVGAIERTAREVAKETSTVLVDFNTRLRQLAQSQNGSTIFGNELFLDHVHPTIEVNRLLALWIIDQLQRSKLVAGKAIDDSSIQADLDNLRKQVLGSINRDDEIFALRNLAKVIHWSGKFEEAIPLARDVLDLAPGDPESSYIVASCLSNLGRTQEALEEYELLFANGIGFPRAYLPYGELLAADGQLEQAKAYLLLAILRNPESADAYLSLGNVHKRLGEDKFAAEAFANAEKLRLNHNPTR